MQLSDRLRSELARYLIGPKLKLLRLHRSMGLLQLGERTGLSPSLLSRVENGKHLPTVPTLLRIALVFNVTLDHFFRIARPERIVSLTRKQEHQRAAGDDPAGNDGCFLSKLDLGPGERKFHPYLAEFQPGKRIRPHTHEGFEFIHVLLGELGLLIGTEESVLRSGDSIYFDSSLRHTYRGLSDETCTALMVCADPGRNATERRMDRLEDLHIVGRQSQANRATSFASVEFTSKRAELIAARTAATREKVVSGVLPRVSLSPIAVQSSVGDAVLGEASTLGSDNRTAAAAKNGKPAGSSDRLPLRHGSPSPGRRKAT